MKTAVKIIGYIVGLGSLAILVNLIYRFGPTVQFWAGFMCGVGFLLMFCGIIVMAQPDRTAQGASKFFLEYRTRRLHKRIARRNAAIGLFALLMFAGCCDHRYKGFECQYHTISWSLGWWTSSVSTGAKGSYKTINMRYQIDSTNYVKLHCQ